MVFRCVDLQGVHAGLVDFLHRRDEGVTWLGKEIHHDEQRVSVVDQQTGEVIDEAPLAVTKDFHQRRVDIVRYAIDHASGKSFEMGYRNFIRSSNYNLTYRIEYARDFIEFNLSVPKYLWGNNILQFVPHSNDLDFPNSYSAGVREMGALTWPRFIRFFEWFNRREFNDLMKASRCLLVRIDLCFNKVFNSKSDALGYLAELKRVRKKYLRSSGDGEWKYATSIFHVTRDYTLKIYHKGDEFKASHKGKPSNYSEVKKRLGLRTAEYLQGFADRILRYEVAFKPRYLDRIFKEKIFRRKCEVWRMGLKMVRQVQSTGYARIGKKKVHPVSFSGEEKRAYKYAKYILSKQFEFYLRRKGEFHLSDTPARPGEFVREMKFSELLFRECVKVFMRMKKEFNVSYSNDLFSLLSKIEGQFQSDQARSDELKRVYQLQCMDGPLKKDALEISFGTVKKFLIQLRTMSFKEIKETGAYSESVFYRYKKFFSAFGISEIVVSQVVPINADTYYDYYLEVDRNISSLNLDNVLRSVF